jgi:soluble lytic murein transglycosylase-like protein
MAKDPFLYPNIVSNNRALFYTKASQIAMRLGIPVDWLMFVMYFESRLNSKITNPYSTAVGLIQFLSATAKALGTSREALLLMSPEEQLFYVEKFLSRLVKNTKRQRDPYRPE